MSVSSGATPQNPVTVSDATPDPAVNPQDPDSASIPTAATQTPGTSTVQQSNGSGLDADTLNHIGGVAASVGGPNVYVATGSDGKLPISIIPAGPAVYAGPTNQEILTLTAGTTYSNGHSTPEWITANADGGSNGNVLCSLNATVGTASAPGTPSVVAALGSCISNGGPAPAVSVSFVVLPGFSYVLTVGGGMSISTVTGWY